MQARDEVEDPVLFTFRLGHKYNPPFLTGVDYLEAANVRFFGRPISRRTQICKRITAHMRNGLHGSAISSKVLRSGGLLSDPCFLAHLF